jgi:hypothetical protein
MQHDIGMRAAARAIYEAVYPTEDWAPLGFDEAEQRGTIHYRQAVDAVLRVKRHFGNEGARQLTLI